MWARSSRRNARIQNTRWSLRASAPPLRSEMSTTYLPVRGHVTTMLDAGMRRSKLQLKSESGQALLETAIVMPFLLILAFNAINFGYFFIVAVNLAAAPRSGAEYSILGFSTPAGDIAGLPVETTVRDLTYGDLQYALPSYTSASVHICSGILGTNPSTGGSNQRSNCTTCTSSSCTSPAAETTGALAPSPDPQAPRFRLHRVDVTYSFSTVIPGTPFNLAVIPTSLCTSGGTCTFHRKVSMRAMD